MIPSVIVTDYSGLKTNSIWRRLHTATRRLLPVVLAALAWGFIPNSTLAAATTREAYTSAATSTSTCIEEGNSTRCTDMSLRVFMRDTGTEVCLTFFSYMLDYSSTPTFEDGCTLTIANVFSVENKRLSSGKLAPTKVMVTLDGCMQTECNREILVAATFTGVGKLSNYPSHSRFNDGTCTHTFRSKSIGREAAVVIVLDNQSLAASGFLNHSKSKTQIRCKIR